VTLALFNGEQILTVLLVGFGVHCAASGVGSIRKATATRIVKVNSQPAERLHQTITATPPKKSAMGTYPAPVQRCCHERLVCKLLRIPGRKFYLALIRVYTVYTDLQLTRARYPRARCGALTRRHGAVGLRLPCNTHFLAVKEFSAESKPVQHRKPASSSDRFPDSGHALRMPDPRVQTVAISIPLASVVVLPSSP
jgi:hypothetical protein